MTSWASRMVDDLCVAKAAGMDFEWAWADALLLNPPGRRECDTGKQLTLYGARDETLEEFLRRVCGDAWYGRRPLLRHLPGLLEAIGDERAVLAVDGHRPSSQTKMMV